MTVLRLAARPNEEHHQKPGHIEGHLVSVVFLNKRKTKIDSRCDPCGSVNGTILEIDWLWPHLHSWDLLRESIAIVPMSHGLLVIKGAGGPQQECTGTDRSHTAGLPSRSCNTRFEPLVVDTCLGSRSTSDDERVDVAVNLLNRRRAREGHSSICLQASVLSRIAYLHFIPGRPRKSFKRTGHVENLPGRSTDDHDFSHPAILA